MEQQFVIIESKQITTNFTKLSFYFKLVDLLEHDKILDEQITR